MKRYVNRHLRACTFDRATIDDRQMLVPFVQRILNSSVSDRNKHLRIVYSGSIKGAGSEIIGTLHSCVLFRATR
jgi:hypothetical protein